MTVWDVVFSAARRWYVYLAGLVCIALALLAIHARPTVYFSRATVFFVAPASRENPNALRLRLDSLVMTAGVVAKRINGTHVPPKLTSKDATIVDRGIYDGTQVRLPDDGGQWSANYNSQVLDVQVAAPSPDLVRERQGQLVAEIQQTLDELQDEQRVLPPDRITIELAPSDPPIDVMRGENRRAQVMTVGTGGLLTLLAVYTVESRARRRSRLLESVTDPSVSRAR